MRYAVQRTTGSRVAPRHKSLLGNCDVRKAVVTTGGSDFSRRLRTNDAEGCQCQLMPVGRPHTMILSHRAENRKHAIRA